LREDFLPEDFLPDDFRLDPFFRGTFAPFSRASLSPMAIACLRLVTFFPLLPLRRVPFLRRRIADSTRLLAAFPYFRPPDFFRAAMTDALLWKWWLSNAAYAAILLAAARQ
jgi:hypothetical protein